MAICTSTKTTVARRAVIMAVMAEARNVVDAHVVEQGGVGVTLIVVAVVIIFIMHRFNSTIAKWLSTIL